MKELTNLVKSHRWSVAEMSLIPDTMPRSHLAKTPCQMGWSLCQDWDPHSISLSFQRPPRDHCAIQPKDQI